MMPDLGEYTAEVTLAYVLSLSVMAVLIGWVMLRARRVKQTLLTLETRLNRKTNG